MSKKNPLKGLSLVHTGLVCQDISSAKQRLSKTLNLAWIGGDQKPWALTVYGKEQIVPLRIAHASTGPANFELIEAVANTPWVTTQPVMQHHLCFYSEHSEATCNALENNDFVRIMGAPGDPQGYFQDASGLLIEVIGDAILEYLNRFYSQSRGRMAT